MSQILLGRTIQTTQNFPDPLFSTSQLTFPLREPKMMQTRIGISITFGVSLVLGMFVALTAVAQEVASENSSSSKSLFNGKDLDGWDGDPRFWRVENGELVGETSETNKAEKNTFLVYRGGEFADFDLKLQYRVTNFNSGVQYRSKEVDKWSVAGYQADFEAQHHKSDSGPIDKFSGMFFEEQGRMFMGQRGQAVIVRTNSEKPKKPLIEVIGSVGDPVVLEKLIRRDDWNEMRVIARGFSFTHIINGHVMSVAYDEDAVHRKASGILAFQLHSGPAMQLRIKDIIIRELK
jgi:hypothetical protein